MPAMKRPYFAEFLWLDCLKRKKVNPRYSLRAHARRLGLDPSSLCRLLAGKQNLTIKTWVQVIERIQPPEDKKLRIQESILLEYARKAAEELGAPMLETTGPMADFVERIAHEIKNPLTSILNQTELMLTKRPHVMLDPITRDGLQNIASSAACISRLMLDLALVSQKHTKWPDLTRKETCAATIVHTVEQIMHPIAYTKGLKLIASLEFKNEDTAIDCDFTRVTQALVNLLSNAIKFTPAGGKVMFRARGYPFGVEFEVSDNGIGIQKSDIPRIFEPYWRKQELGKEGRGLGLSIVKEIIDHHGGLINVESAEAKGTRVTISLPRCAYQTSASPNAA